MSDNIELGVEGGSRNSNEVRAVDILTNVFENSDEPTAVKLADFAKYMRRQDLTKLLVRYEIFKRILPVKGSIVECGVFRGAGLMTWANLSATLEPNNLLRKIYGFDTFAGFPEIGELDHSPHHEPAVGELRADSRADLERLVEAFDLNRFLGHIPKVEIVAGDARVSMPAFVEANPHVVVSLLYLDFDLYEPTRVALETFLPRMPRGSIVAFDELDNPAWPGETLAAIDGGLTDMRLERLDFDPYVAFAVR